MFNIAFALLLAVSTAQQLNTKRVTIDLSFDAIPHEDDYTSNDLISLYRCYGNEPIATNVPRAFAVAIATHPLHQGVLRNGNALFRQCLCSQTFHCFQLLDNQRFPYGKTEYSSRPLLPFSSLIINETLKGVLSIGNTVFVEGLNGTIIPGTTNIHNGCFVVGEIVNNLMLEDANVVIGNSLAIPSAQQFFEQVSKANIIKSICTPRAYILTPAESSSSTQEPNPFDTRKEFPKYPNEPCIQEENCHMPNCRCFTFDPPQNMSREQIPFFITLTWDDIATPDQVNNIIARLESVPRDAGGCHVRSTLFITWQYNGVLQDMVTLRRLEKAGNKIGLHTFWHTTSQNSTLDEWKKQIMAGKFASNLAGVNANGTRTPYTHWNGNFLQMLNELNIEYDSSHIFNSYTSLGKYSWPHTLNWGPIQGVKDIVGWFNPVGNLSTLSPGVWEHYMTEILVHGSRNTTHGTSMEPPVTSADEIYNTLQWNFELHYNSTNRAPFGIYWHLSSIGSWSPGFLDGLERFLTNVVKEHSDVYFATVPEIISWVKNPVPVGEFQGFGCANDGSVMDDPCDGQGSIVCRANLPNPIPPGVTQPIAQEYSVCGTECPDWTLGSEN